MGARGFQVGLHPVQFLDLYLQFDLVHPQFMQEFDRDWDPV
jgi:hypothetical protein